MQLQAEGGEEKTAGLLDHVCSVTCLVAATAAIGGGGGVPISCLKGPAITVQLWRVDITYSKL